VLAVDRSDWMQHTLLVLVELWIARQVPDELVDDFDLGVF